MTEYIKIKAPTPANPMAKSALAGSSGTGGAGGGGSTVGGGGSAVWTVALMTYLLFVEPRGVGKGSGGVSKVKHHW